MNRWVGKVAVVTGASSGIGAAIVKDFAKAGLIVIGLARRTERIEELKAELKGAKGELHAYYCDVSKIESVKKAFAWIEEKFGGVNVLVNNSGIVKMDQPILTDTDNFEALKSIVDVNFLGLVACTQEAYRLMKKIDDYGHIVQINSIAGHKVPNIAGFNMNVYPSTKYGVTALTEVIRQELNTLGNRKIRVTSVSPGGVLTEISGMDLAVAEEMYKGFPMLKAEDVSDAVLYAIGAPSTVQIHELIIKPVGEEI